MDILNYFFSHQAQFLFLLGALALVIELTVMGMSGPLLFFALGCFVSAMLTALGVLNGWESETLSVGVFSVGFTLALWKPLKRFQNSGGGPDTSSDMIGKQVPCSAKITEEKGSIRYSGINWNARLDSSLQNQAAIEEGETCIISGVDGNVMLVKPKNGC